MINDDYELVEDVASEVDETSKKDSFSGADTRRKVEEKLEEVRLQRLLNGDDYSYDFD